MVVERRVLDIDQGFTSESGTNVVLVFLAGLRDCLVLAGVVVDRRVLVRSDGPGANTSVFCRREIRFFRAG